MNRIGILALGVLAGIAGFFVGQTTCTGATEFALNETTTLRFADVETGRRVLAKRDRFVESLSRFDLQCRLQTDKEVSTDQFLEFASQQVIDWEPAALQRVVAALESIRDRLNQWDFPWPETILLVHTTGRDEGGAAYCRGNAIVLPGAMLNGSASRLRRLLVHELFHVLGNHNPHRREALYAIVGFHRCEAFVLPLSLRDRKITNPDAPTLEYYIEIQHEDKPQKAMPLLYANADRYDPRRRENLFRYMTFRLLLIQHREGRWEAVLRDDAPVLLVPQQVDSFVEQIGRNTSYIIHPEEVLADNFVHLVMQTDELPTPRVVAELERELARREPPK